MKRLLPDHCVLTRTPEGLRRMRSRSAGLPARFRSVLFLVDGSQPLHRILAKAGQLGPLLEGQLAELLDMGLIEIAGQPRAVAANVAPIVGAKMRLLDSLEKLDHGRLARRGSSLVEARSWKELARNTRELALVVQDVAGDDAAAGFWAEAKEILLACRGLDSAGQPR